MRNNPGSGIVPHIVQAWPVTVAGAAQPNLPGHRVESSVNISAIQTIAPVGNEQVGGHRPCRPMTFPPRDIVSKYLAS